MTILLVDDHPEFRLLLREFLQGPSINFIEASNGGAAILAYNAHRPDWTLMDLDMPEMDGIAATQAIRTSFPGAKIVMVTQHDNPAIRQAAEEAGLQGFVSKDRLCELWSLIDKSNLP